MKSKLAKAKESTDIENILSEKYSPPTAEKAPITKKSLNEKKKAEKDELIAIAKAAAATAAPRSTKNGPTQISKTARMAGGAARKRDVVRVSIDFPRPMYEMIVTASDQRAQTLREFMLHLVRESFAE